MHAWFCLRLDELIFSLGLSTRSLGASSTHTDSFIAPASEPQKLALCLSIHSRCANFFSSSLSRIFLCSCQYTLPALSNKKPKYQQGNLEASNHHMKNTLFFSFKDLNVYFILPSFSLLHNIFQLIFNAFNFNMVLSLIFIINSSIILMLDASKYGLFSYIRPF